MSAAVPVTPGATLTVPAPDLQFPAGSSLADLCLCGRLHVFSCQEDGPPLLLGVSHCLLSVDFPARVRVRVVTQALASPPQVVHQAVAIRFELQDGLKARDQDQQSLD